MENIRDETSLALVSAAHRLLAEHGSQALTVRRIATEAGMSTMNVYSRFGGKDGVIDVLYVDGFERLFAAIQGVPNTDDLRTDLLAIAHSYRQFALDNPTYYRVMFRSAIHDFTPSPEASDVALSGLQLLVDRIDTAQPTDNVTSQPGQDAKAIAAWLWATCHGMVSLELDELAIETLTWSAIFDGGIEIALSGLLPSVSR